MTDVAPSLTETGQRLQLYADIVHNIPVGVVVWQLEDLNDPSSFRLLIANPTASATTGLDFEAMIGKTMTEVFPQILQTPLMQQYLEVVCNGRSLDLGEVSYSADGISAGVYSLKAFPLSNHCLGLAFENITERKQIEYQLRESQRYNQQIAAALPGVLFLHDLIQQNNVYTNRQITDLLGYTSEQVQAMGPNAVATLVHPDDLERVAAYSNTFCSALDDITLGIEYRAHHANGGWCWLYTQSVVFKRTAEGLPWQILGVSIDITDRKQTEEALAEQEQRYRYIFEAVSVAIWEEDFSDVKAQIDQLKAIGIQHFRQYFIEHPDFVRQMANLVRIRDVNRAALQMFGAQKKAELLSSLNQIFVPETQAVFIEELLAIANGETFFAAETILQTLQGERLNVWFSITFPCATEPFDRVLVSLLDITERKQVEVERERLLIRERAAREQAETANRIKDEFLAVLSHELRSPLNPILGWTKLLQTSKFNTQKTKQALDIIERNAKQQTQLIDDLLDISRILQGKLVLTEAPVNLALTIESALETVRLAAEAKNIQIRTNLDNSLPSVLGDAGRLQQIVLNLLSNAIKFTPPGGWVEVRLEGLEKVRAEEHCKDEVQEKNVSSYPLSPNFPHPPASTFNYAKITVSDTGKGIAPDFLPYVFDSFRQEDGKITRKFGGLGLGLAIVRQLTELHGGTIQAQSSGEGAGATFTVHLPLMQTPDLTLEHGSLVDESTNNLDVLQGIRVLVVDDEPDMRELTALILEQAGASVQVAASAAQAIAILDQFQPTIIVSDIGMPETDGFEFIRNLRSRSSGPGKHIPAIALTAYAMEQDEQQALAAGFQRHIAKPVEPDVLIRLISTLACQK